MKKPKEFFVLDDIAPQLSNKQIEDLKSVIYMAKEIGEPQLAYTDDGLGLKLMVFPSGLLTRKFGDMDGYEHRIDIAEMRRREASKNEI